MNFSTNTTQPMKILIFSSSFLFLIENRQQSDDVRLESIKRQILSRLGLKRKPNVTHPLPKQFIWDTIYRADGISSVIDFDFNDDHRRQRIISSRDGQKLVKFAATAAVQSPFNEVTSTSYKTTAMAANSRVTRAYSPFLGHAIEATENGGDVESSTNGYGNGYGNVYGDIIEDLGNASDDKKQNENEHQTTSFVYQRRQQQQQQHKYRLKQRYPKEKSSRSYHSYGNGNSNGYGTSVHHTADQKKKIKSYNFDNEAATNSDDWEKDSPYESEEFYGITQEIILFAEKGKLCSLFILLLRLGDIYRLR